MKLKKHRPFPFQSALLPARVCCHEFFHFFPIPKTKSLTGATQAEEIGGQAQNLVVAAQFGDHKSEARIQSNQQMTESILDASSAAHGGEENDMSDYKGAMHGSGPHASYK